MQVQPRELINQQWRLKDTTVVPHMAAIVELGEQRMNWVMSMICLNQKFKRNVISFFIGVAKHLLKLHNMNAFSQVCNKPTCLSQTIHSSILLHRLNFRALTHPSAQVVAGLNHEFVDAEHFPALWHGVKSDEEELLREYTELLAPGSSGMYHNYREHLKLVRQKAKCAIPAWEIFLKDLYKVQTRRPWIVPAEQRRINVDKAVQVRNEGLHTRVRTHMHTPSMSPCASKSCGYAVSQLCPCPVGARYDYAGSHDSEVGLHKATRDKA